MSLVETVSNRELLWNLTLRELRTRYRRSSLGWAWSLLNPLATMVIFTSSSACVFDARAAVGRPERACTAIPLYLLCGLLPWTFFACSVATAMGSVIAQRRAGEEGLVPARGARASRRRVAGSSSLAIEMGVLRVVLLIAGNMVLPWLVPLVARCSPC